jgi:tetratricopeptide (TPR) repeat protein
MSSAPLPPPLPPRWPPLVSAPPPPAAGPGQAPPPYALPAWQAPPPPKPPRSHLRLILALVAAVILLIGSGAGGLLWMRHARVVRHDTRIADELVKHLNPSNVTGVPPPASLPEGDRDDMIGIAVFMDNLRTALHARNKAALTQQVDARRLLQWCNKQKFISTYPSSADDPSATRAASGIAEDFAKPTGIGWDRHDITRIRFLSGDQIDQAGGDAGAREAVISVRTWKGDRQVPMRWWLRGKRRDWKWYDYEFLDGTRCGLSHGVYAARNSGDQAAPWTNRLSTWDELVDAYLNRKWDKVEEAGTALAKLDPWQGGEPVSNGPTNLSLNSDTCFPPIMEANYLRFRGEELFVNGDNEGAIKLFDAAEKFFPDLPDLYIVRARARNGAGQYVQALADINKYRDDYATDGLFHRTAGVALMGVGRNAEALAEFRKALDEFPDDVDSFVGLSRALPVGDKSELVDRFAASRKPDDVFYALPPRLDNEDDVASLEALAAAEHVRRPTDIWADFYRARALMIHQSWAPAADLLQPILAKAPTPEASTRFVGNYLSALIAAGDPVRAYHNLPDRGEAFKRVAARLSWPKTAKNAALLRKLLKARRADVTSDPWLDFYTGGADEMEGRLDAADAAYTHGLSQGLDPDTADRYRSARVIERCQAGHWTAAFEEDSHDDAFRDKTFRQIAYYLQGRQQIDDLDRLASDYRLHWPDSPLSPMWKAEVLYQRHQYARAREVLTVDRGKILLDPDQDFTFSDRLIRCLVQQRELDDAMTEAVASAARDAERASKEKPADNSIIPAPADAPVPDPTYVLMISAARGDVAQATAAFEKCVSGDSDPEDLYADPEIGPLLRGPAFAALRLKYPPPKAETQPAR